MVYLHRDISAKKKPGPRARKARKGENKTSDRQVDGPKKARFGSEEKGDKHRGVLTVITLSARFGRTV